MTLAYWMVLVAALLPYCATGYFKFAGGGGKSYDNHAPRAQLDAMPPDRKRAYWAQLNGFEAFPPFAAGVIIAHLAGGPQHWINVLAVTFVLLRAAYTLCYIHDRPTARSLVWCAGVLCVFGLFGVTAL